jgi:hypothetical protein
MQMTTPILVFTASILPILLFGCARSDRDYGVSSDPRAVAFARCKGEAAAQVGDHIIFAQSSVVNQVTRQRKIADLTDGCMARLGYVVGVQ